MCSSVLTYRELNNLAVWNNMQTITLEQMSGVKLMNRIDTKYVLSESDVLALLDELQGEDYRVQVLGDVRAARYDTLYYDTVERDMYLVHHNRQLCRQKIRTRVYVESNIAFLEVKNKSNRGRTKKRRTAIGCEELADFSGNVPAVDFLCANSHYDYAQLLPALATRFIRVTLVNPHLTERVTIDLSLCYEDVRSHTTFSIPGMAIVELKQDGKTISTVKRIMRDMCIMPLKVSKYCLGTALTVDGIKKNRFKLKIRDIEKCLTQKA